MDVSSAFVAKIFGKKSLYEILGVEKTATQDDIKRGYRKLALVFHPDRSTGDEDKFKALSIVHSILSDSSKRELYDNTGDVNDEDADESFKDWYDYFRNLFPKLTSEKIEKFSETYIGSEEERNDLVEAYKKFSGDMDKIMEVIIFAEAGEEERLCSTIDSIISFGDLESSSKFEKFKARHQTAAGNPKKKRKIARKEDKPESDLSALILQRNASRGDNLANIMAKYGGNSRDPFDDISDEAFQKTQDRISKEVKDKSRKSKKDKR